MEGRFAAGCALALVWGLLSGCSPEPAGVSGEIPELPRPVFEGFSDAARQQVERFYRTAKENPENDDANGRLGMVLQAYEQYQGAEACYLRALHFAPDSFRWTYYLGAVQARVGKTEEAIETSRAAVALQPESLPARLRLADLLTDRGDLEDVREILSGLVEKHPQSAAVHYRLGEVDSLGGDVAGAIRHYRRGVELDPEHRQAHYGLAQAYREAGKPENSQRHLALYEQSNPNRVRDYSDPLMEAVERLRTGTTLYHLDEGRRLEAAGNIAEAEAEYQKALAADPSYFQAHVNLISVYGKLGEYQKAEKHYHEAVRINPEVEEAHYNYGVTLVILGRHQEAVKAFQRALEINPQSADSHNNLGFALEETGQIDAAMRHYRLALKHQPNFRLAHYHLGRHLAARGAFGEAIEHLEKSVTTEDERTPLFLYHLAQAYARNGETPRATEALKRARELAVTYGQDEIVAAIDRVSPVGDSR